MMWRNSLNTSRLEGIELSAIMDRQNNLGTELREGYPLLPLRHPSFLLSLAVGSSLWWLLDLRVLLVCHAEKREEEEGYVLVFVYSTLDELYYVCCWDLS